MTDDEHSGSANHTSHITHHSDIPIDCLVCVGSKGDVPPPPIAMLSPTALVAGGRTISPIFV